MPEVLYHISDLPDIARFEPCPASRAVPGQEKTLVWAIDDEHLHNYLLPRECPRVTFYALPTSDQADVERLMGGTDVRYVVAIESRWLPEVWRTRLYRYALPPGTFMPQDVGASYYVSSEPVVPLSVTAIDDLLAALLERPVGLRIMPSLWKLRDQVIASTLQYSLIRMCNAQPPADGYAAHFPL